MNPVTFQPANYVSVSVGTKSVKCNHDINEIIVILTHSANQIRNKKYTSVVTISLRDI